MALYAQRWSEYLASASLMLLLTCALLGIRETHTIICVVALMATTQVFGWLTELHASHFIDDNAKPYTLLGYQLTRRWRIGTWRHRMQMHLFGYIPYVAAWFVVFNQFSINMRALASSVPGFVQTATTSSFAVFTVFGFVQLAHQVLPYGPSLYWAGEFTYVVLSFVAKANLVRAPLPFCFLPYTQMLCVHRAWSFCTKRSSTAQRTTGLSTSPQIRPAWRARSNMLFSRCHKRRAAPCTVGGALRQHKRTEK